MNQRHCHSIKESGLLLPVNVMMKLSVLPYQLTFFLCPLTWPLIIVGRKAPHVKWFNSMCVCVCVCVCDILSTCSLGVVFGFVSNQKVSISVSSLENTASSALQDGVNYLNNTLNVRQKEGRKGGREKKKS